MKLFMYAILSITLLSSTSFASEHEHSASEKEIKMGHEACYAKPPQSVAQVDTDKNDIFVLDRKFGNR